MMSSYDATLGKREDGVNVIYPSKNAMTKNIAFFVFSGYQMLDLSGPLCVFQTAHRLAGDDPYRLFVTSSQGGPVTNSLGLTLQTRKATLRAVDTFIVVGGNIDNALADCEIAAIRKQARHTRRLASVCTGAFALAQANLLVGKKATTHWRFAPRLQRDFPHIRVHSDAIYIKDGNTWTSAGITAGMDLALAMIQEDLGLALASAVAQEMVLYHRRSGGQSQFSALAQLTPESQRMQVVLSFMREHVTETLPVERLAAVARLSDRQFGRAFRAETGETPAKAVERIRAEVAHALIAETAEPIEMIAIKAGFGDPERMRRAFLRLYGHPPQSVRRNFRAF
jgi:transcriptional regulator GlxA family with amidase domain